MKKNPEVIFVFASIFYYLGIIATITTAVTLIVTAVRAGIIGLAFTLAACIIGTALFNAIRKHEVVL